MQQIHVVKEKRKQSRYSKGAVIAVTRRIIRTNDEEAWLVESETVDGKYYKVTVDGVCECPNHQIRGQTCKHAYAIFRRVTQ
jgi:malate/lactate dehydrogenase